MTPSHLDICGVIDHTFLKTEAQGFSPAEQEQAVRKLVHEALSYKAFSVCIYPRWIATALQAASGVKLPITAVIGFPTAPQDAGASAIAELKAAREQGASEFDMVVRVDELKNQHYAAFEEQIYNISQAAGRNVLKIIFENAYLTEMEKPLAYKIARQALEASWHDSQLHPHEAIRFFKTSTGFAKVSQDVPVGATLDDVQAMAAIAAPNIGIKPAGGVNNYDEAIQYWKAAGAPLDAHGLIDPYRFRIGSSGLLLQLSRDQIE